MTAKQCRECGEVKSLSEFYAHSKMADGHLNKCKPCVKSRVAKHREENLEEIQAYDRERGQDPERKALVTANRPKYHDKRKVYTERWQAQNPEKRAAHIKVGNAIRDGKISKQPCEVCSEIEVEAHHDDYAKPLDVRWLCAKHHGVTRRIDPAEAAE